MIDLLLTNNQAKLLLRYIDIIIDECERMRPNLEGKERQECTRKMLEFTFIKRRLIERGDESSFK